MYEPTEAEATALLLRYDGLSRVEAYHDLAEHRHGARPTLAQLETAEADLVAAREALGLIGSGNGDANVADGAPAIDTDAAGERGGGTVEDTARAEEREEARDLLHELAGEADELAQGEYQTDPRVQLAAALLADALATECVDDGHGTIAERLLTWYADDREGQVRFADAEPGITIVIRTAYVEGVR